MIGRAKVRPIQQKTFCPHDLVLGYPYFLRIKSLSDMSCVVLLTFGSHLRNDYERSLTKRRMYWSQQSATPILDELKFGQNQSVTIRSKLREALLKSILNRVDNMNDKLFKFTKDTSQKEVHSISDDHHPLSRSDFTITLHPFRNEGAFFHDLTGQRSFKDIMRRGFWKLIRHALITYEQIDP